MSGPSRSLLRHPDFLKLWTAETVSVFGSAVTQLALPLIAATVLKVSAFEFGLLTTIEFLPFILLSLPAGVWVDRLRRRPILIAADLGRAITIASIPVAFAFDALTIWQLYAVGFLNGCLTVFFDVAYMSYLPSIVERDQLVEGNSKLEITRSASQILGPGASGLLIGLFRAPASPRTRQPAHPLTCASADRPNHSADRPNHSAYAKRSALSRCGRRPQPGRPGAAPGQDRPYPSSIGMWTPRSRATSIARS